MNQKQALEQARAEIMNQQLDRALTALGAAGITDGTARMMTIEELVRLPMMGPRRAQILKKWLIQTAKTVVVTRHAILVELLIQEGIITADTPVLSHATADDVRGKHVIGVLPLSLACLAARVTEVPLDLSPEDRGKELTLERMRYIAAAPVNYVVRKEST